MELTFRDCLLTAIHNAEFVAQFNRLNGTHLGVDKRVPIERMVDEATGYQKVLDTEGDEGIREFIAFVYAFIWLPLSEVGDEA